MIARLSTLLLACALLVSCASRTPHPEWASVHECTPSFLQDLDATDPSLALGPSGALACTWVTRDTSGGGDVWLTISRDGGAQFTSPIRLNPAPGRVSSYTESRPIVAWSPRGDLIVVWAAKRDSGAYADDLVSRSSSDGGATFGPTTFLNSDHIDPRSTYHGFATLAFQPDGRAVAAWIDGRASLGAEEPMAGEIYLTTSRDAGRHWEQDARVAGEVCACCRIQLVAEPASAAGPARVALAYRGMRGDLRDPRLAILRTDSLAVVLDTLVSADHWFMRGCPSVGPTLTFDSDGGHYLWFTGESAADSAAPPKRTPPGVYFSSWRSESGATSAPRALRDSLADATRPMLADLGSTALLGVIGHPASDRARSVLAVRMLEAEDTLTPWLFLGSGVRSGALAGGSSGTAYAAWVEKDVESLRVRLARITRLAR